jgi:RNA polymerase sigma factor (sigma-70 family)
MADEDEVTPLVRAAAAGDQGAWDQLVARYQGLLWAVTRSFRLYGHDAADVSQATWLRLVEHLGDIRDPTRVGSWLATTARRECLRRLRREGREEPIEVDDYNLPVDEDPPDAPERVVLTEERDRLLWEAVDQLAPRCQRLLRVLMADPPVSYQQVGAALDMPTGSIGPTRARCLDCLRRRLDHSAIPA